MANQSSKIIDLKFTCLPFTIIVNCLHVETMETNDAQCRRGLLLHMDSLTRGFLILPHCILNRFSHTMYWKDPISILGTSGYEIVIFLEKIAKLFANSGDPGFALIANYPIGVSRLQWVK